MLDEKPLDEIVAILRVEISLTRPDLVHLATVAVRDLQTGSRIDRLAVVPMRALAGHDGRRLADVAAHELAGLGPGERPLDPNGFDTEVRVVEARRIVR